MVDGIGAEYDVGRKEGRRRREYFWRYCVSKCVQERNNVAIMEIFFIGLRGK